MSDNNYIETVIHGRGGAGVVTCANITVEAAYLSGRFVDVHAYPSFGAERRGAPVQAYAKLSKTEKIWDRSEIENPDIIVVLDDTVLNQSIASSLKSNGTIIINSKNHPDYFSKKYNLSEDTKVIVADINKLAIEKELTIEGAPIVNIPILGLLSKAIPELDLDNLEKIIQKRVNKKYAKLNIELLKQTYNLAEIL